MTSRADLARLGELAALRAARDRAALAAVERRAGPIRAALARLDVAAPATPPDDLREARDHALWQAWAATERRRLTMELSRLRAELDGARRLAARGTAREAVIERLRDAPRPR